MRTLLAVCAIGCGAGSSQPTAEEPLVIKMPVFYTPTVTPILDEEPPVYDAEIQSVRFAKATTLRIEPRSDSDEVGVIGKDVRAAVQSAAPGDDTCKSRWIQISPRGWACETVLEPSHEPPSTATIIDLEDEDTSTALVPGVYGIVRKDAVAYANRDEVLAGEGSALEGSNSVRAAGVVSIDGRRYWRTTRGDLIDTASIIYVSPSKFRGVAIEPDTAMPVWVRSSRKPIRTYATAMLRGRPVRELAPRTIVTILEESLDRHAARIADGEWIARRELRAATLAAPPPGTGADEKWFDVDLDEQVLVAYEGERPVYATMVSTGKWRHETPTSIARIRSKHVRATMTSNKEDIYSVADVPWTMYYDGNYALHTSYWHDGFGGPRSHGCINLAPRDARILYFWSSPDVPPGWLSVYGSEAHPGSLVRTRSRKDPEPSFRGYAKTMHETRTDAVASR